MGYYISLLDHDVEVIALYQPLALAALKELCDDSLHLSWVDQAAVREAETLANALRKFHYNSEIREKGSLFLTEFTGGKLGSEDILWPTLAPFMRDLSYLEYEGEDGARWRYSVSVGKLYTQEGRWEWDAPKPLVLDPK